MSHRTMNTNGCPDCSKLRGELVVPEAHPTQPGVHSCPKCGVGLAKMHRPNIFGPREPFFVRVGGGGLEVHDSASAKPRGSDRGEDT